MVVCSNNWCNKEFENYLEDQELLKKFDIQNSMKICPTCRHINRASFKFTIFLHKRKSDLSKKSLFSIFHPENPFPVYDIDEWWSDDYAPYKYGRNFDFNKTFFEQFQTLHNEVPKLARIISKSENCDFAPYASNCKNVYYSNGIFSSQNIFFSDTITNQSNNICDSVRCFQSSYLYASTECLNTHYSAFVENCHNSRELYFCYDMLGSSNCIFSSNLRNKEYFAFNKFVGKDDFENIKNKYLDGSYKTHLECLRLYERVKAEAFTVATAQSNCENCRGHNLLQSFNSFECYHCRNLNSSRYCIHVGAGGQNINSMDLTNGGIGELIYNSCSVGGGNYFLRMCLYCRYSSFLTYCIDCYHSNNCFASVGLKKGTYTILNKTYLKSEYIDLTKKIVSHLKATGEWGGFFPNSISTVPYNESFAMVLNPLSEKEIIERGYIYRKPQIGIGNNFSDDLPDSSYEINQSIYDKIFKCNYSGLPYKIIKQEVDFLKLFKLPLPRQAPMYRMINRYEVISKTDLCNGECSICKKNLESYYDFSSRKILCHDCFIKQIY